MDAKSKSSRFRWRQISLRGLLLLTTAIALLLGWFTWRLQKVRNEREAAAAIVRAGGEIALSDQFDGHVSRLTPLSANEANWVGGWCERTFGCDPFRRLVSVKLFDDESTALISKYALHDLQIIRLEGGAACTDEGLEHIRNCLDLRVLYLERSGITDRGLESIKGCRRLEELWLANTEISDAALEKVAGLPALRVLDVRWTSVSDNGLKTIANMPALELLYLDSGNLTDDALLNLQKAPRLQSLWLGEQSSAKFDLAKLADFPRLANLTVTGSLITDDRLKSLAANTRIEYLNLQGCTQLTDEALAALSEAVMPSLKSLRITAARPGPPFSARAINQFKAKKPACKVW